MAKVRASDVGFCVVDDNANVIADNLVHRIREANADLTLAGGAAALLGPVTVSSAYLMEFGIDLGGSRLVSGR